MIRLVGGIEPILALAGRWEAWRDVLDQGLEAAVAAGDEFAEADFAHQLGTLELCLGRSRRSKRSDVRSIGCFGRRHESG